MLPNWLYGKSKSKLANILGGGGGTPADYDQVKAQVTQNKLDIAQLTADTNGLLDNMMENGAVNLINFNPATVTKEETTFTRNSDGTYTVVVTAATAATREVHIAITLPSGSYKLTGTPSNGSNICRMTVYSITESRNLAVDEGSGSEFTITQTNKCGVYIDLKTGVPAGTYVFKPMISDPSLNLSYDDYVPYAKSNRELTEKLTADASLNTAISLSAYTAYSNMYTAPSDGYVHFQSAASGSTARTIYTYGNNTTAATDPHFTHSTSANDEAFEIFIKKGLKVYVDGLQSGDTINFYSLSYS